MKGNVGVWRWVVTLSIGVKERIRTKTGADDGNRHPRYRSSPVDGEHPDREGGCSTAIPQKMKPALCDAG